MAIADFSVNAAAKELPAVPLTLEGAAILHQMFRLRWAEWHKLSSAAREEVTKEFNGVFARMEGEGASAAYSLLGHKGDLLFIHFRNSFDELNQIELQLNQLRVREFIEPMTSYVSVIELGLYESTVKLYTSLAEKAIVTHSAEWRHACEEVLNRQREAMRPRLFPKIPGSRYVCFYPMDRRRGEQQNWYRLSIEERQRQMEEHGLVGRRYAGQVQQIISGSIGFDDWEWGVDLFADDPLVFKKLIYEMRFDEVSAVYALFGTFYLGIRCPSAKLGDVLSANFPVRS